MLFFVMIFYELSTFKGNQVEIFYYVIFDDNKYILHFPNESAGAACKFNG